MEYSWIKISNISTFLSSYKVSCRFQLILVSFFGFLTTATLSPNASHAQPAASIVHRRYSAHASNIQADMCTQQLSVAPPYLSLRDPPVVPALLSLRDHHVVPAIIVGSAKTQASLHAQRHSAPTQATLSPQQASFTGDTQLTQAKSKLTSAQTAHSRTAIPVTP